MIGLWSILEQLGFRKGLENRRRKKQTKKYGQPPSRTNISWKCHPPKILITTRNFCSDAKSPQRPQRKHGSNWESFEILQVENFSTSIGTRQSSKIRMEYILLNLLLSLLQSRPTAIACRTFSIIEFRVTQSVKTSNEA